MKLAVRSILIVSTLVCCFGNRATGEPVWGRDSRGTLFHWGQGFTGGPDLLEPLVTDRPDFTEASSTVGYGVGQIEAGYTYTNDEIGGTDIVTHTYPERLLRFGWFANWLEFRVADGFIDEKTDGAGVFGRQDLYFGLKIGLTPQQGLLPETALIPQMTFDTGDRDFTADRVLGGVNLIYSWSIGENFSLAGSTQANDSVDGFGDNFTEWAQSVAVGASLTDNLGFYAEYYAILPDGGAVGLLDEHYLNGGFAVLLTNDIQWDIRAGLGLNEAADDWFIGTGVSIRFTQPRKSFQRTVSTVKRILFY